MDCRGWSQLPCHVHGIFQAIVLECIAISFSRGSSRARDQTWVSHIVDRRLTVWATREVHIVKTMVFPVVMFRCESWTIKKAECWRTDAFELWCWRRFLRVLWDYKEVKAVNLKGNQPWIFIGRTDTEADVTILWPLDGKSWLFGKDPEAGKDWRQKEKGVAEYEMVN